MPLFEYFCSDCQVTVETLRPVQKADDPIHCPKCGQTSPQRILSLFASSVKSNGEAAGGLTPMNTASMMGGGCCGGACGCSH